MIAMHTMNQDENSRHNDGNLKNLWWVENFQNNETESPHRLFICIDRYKVEKFGVHTIYIHSGMVVDIIEVCSWVTRYIILNPHYPHSKYHK